MYDVDGIGTGIFGRRVHVGFGDLDESGQFRVTLSVDGKVRWEGHFTDKSEDAGNPMGGKTGGTNAD